MKNPRMNAAKSGVFIKSLSAGLSLCALLCAGGCAKPPVEEMENAASAVTRAENDPDAVRYAAAILTRARDALSSMRSEAEAKRYGSAKSFAAEAISAAERAIAAGRAGAVLAREEAASLLDQVKNSLEETGKSLENAKTVQGIALDFNILDRDYDGARRIAAQAELSLAGENYQDSIGKSRTARGMLSDINSEISGAVISGSRKE
ncbi:MAG: DUF4398 domain-containing protein [Treponema sp.]|jgi:hypothetical protein|nr:DUF4398 domain-containing protein [Treponema sp.]